MYKKIVHFRLDILPIKIETGRYVGEHVDKRLCEICKDGNVEDEIHIIFICNKYNHIREKYLRLEILSDRNLTYREKLNIIVNEFCGKIAKYIVEAMELRSNVINSK